MRDEDVGSVTGSIGPATVGTPFAHANLEFLITAEAMPFVALTRLLDSCLRQIQRIPFVSPPSTLTVAPVTKLALSEARNTITLARSVTCSRTSRSTRYAPVLSRA